MAARGMTYTQPLLLLFSLAALIGLARIWHCRRKGLLLVATRRSHPVCVASRRMALLASIGSPISGAAVSRGPGIQAIVVFASSVSPPIFERPYPQPDFQTVERCAFAAWLYRQIGPVPVLACGGGRTDRSPATSVVMRDLLQQAGVPQDMIWTEEESKSTYENGRFGATILRSRGISRVALVVDGRSMPRATAVLEKQGIRVAPAPSRIRQWDGPKELLPSWEAIRGNEDTLHETLGYLWYKLHGWI